MATEHQHNKGFYVVCDNHSMVVELTQLDHHRMIATGGVKACLKPAGKD